MRRMFIKIPNFCRFPTYIAYLRSRCIAGKAYIPLNPGTILTLVVLLDTVFYVPHPYRFNLTFVFLSAFTQGALARVPNIINNAFRFVRF